METESRESFIFYRSFYEAIHDLKDDIKLEVFTAITEYALYGKVPEDLKPVAKGMFTLIRPNLDANTARYENGKKGGRKPRKPQVAAGLSSGEIPSPPRLSPAAPIPTFSSYEKMGEQLKSEQAWLEATCMQFHIDFDEIKRRLDAFVLHCKVEKPGELHHSIQDARRHFSSWMRKAYPAPLRDSKEQSKPDDYTFRGGFGGLD